MPLTNKQKKVIFKANMTSLKRLKKEYWLTDSEHLEMRAHLKILRSKTPNEIVKQPPKRVG